MRGIQLEILSTSNQPGPLRPNYSKKYRLTIEALGDGFACEGWLDDIPEDRLIDHLIAVMGSQIQEYIRGSLNRHKERYGTYDTTVEQRTPSTSEIVYHYMMQQEAMGISPATSALRELDNIPIRALETRLRQAQEQAFDSALRYGTGIGETMSAGYPSTGFGGLPLGDIHSLGRFPTPSKADGKGTPYRKSMILLLRKIGMRKFIQLKKKGYFEEKGKHGTYRFHMDTQGGVTLIQKHTFGKKEREVEWSLCVQSSVANMPKGDVILSRWLEWKVDEDKFLETANFRNIKTADEAHT